MGHYLLLKLLNIEDKGEFNLRRIISDVKIKDTAKTKAHFKDESKNLRILIFSDIII